MIYKWNELDYYHFNEFLQKFEDGDEWTKNKIMEIQDPYALIIGKQRRVFFGRGIHAKDFKEYNVTFLKLIKALSSGIPDIIKDFEGEDCVSMCMLSEETGPKIIPLINRGDKSSLTYVRHTLFGEIDEEVLKISKILNKGGDFSNGGPQLWYEKNDEGSREIWIPHKENLPQTKRIIRFRTMDVEDWKRLMKDFLENNDFSEMTAGDLTLDDFVIMPETSRIIYKAVQDHGGFDKIFGD